MTKNVSAASLHSKTSEIAIFFAEKKINHIPVLNDQQKLVGIVSIKDVMRDILVKLFNDGASLSAENIDTLIPLQSIMTSEVVSVDINDSIDHCKRLLSKNEFQTLPVLDGENLVGMLSIKDLIKLKIIKVDGSDYNPI
jgi:CBS domain-containing protein